MNTNEEYLVGKGLTVSSGIVDGYAYVYSENNKRKITENDILVLKSSDPSYAIDVMQAGGVIMEIGGKLAHLCIVALEMGIPCITQVDNVASVLKDGQKILLDAFRGEIYDKDR